MIEENKMPEKYISRARRPITSYTGLKSHLISIEDFIEIQDTYCTRFGCAKILTRAEKLCGGFCINHMVRQDIANIETLLNFNQE